MKTNKLISVIVLSAMLTAACSKERELEKSVFIPDDTFPELPAYSEWGYNTFGAFYDRLVFISSDYQSPLRVSATVDTTYFIFTGVINRPDIEVNKMTLIFAMDNFFPNDYRDLISLHNTWYDLLDPGIKVKIMESDISKNVSLIEGTLNFKRAQNLRVDEQQVETILSGTFDLKAIIDDEPISISEGRFDVGVGTYNFFDFK